MNIDLIDYENKEYFYSRDVNEEVLSFFRRYGIRLGRKKFNWNSSLLKYHIHEVSLDYYKLSAILQKKCKKFLC